MGKSLKLGALLLDPIMSPGVLGLWILSGIIHLKYTSIHSPIQPELTAGSISLSKGSKGRLVFVSLGLPRRVVCSMRGWRYATGIIRSLPSGGEGVLGSVTSLVLRMRRMKRCIVLNLLFSLRVTNTPLSNLPIPFLMAIRNWDSSWLRCSLRSNVEYCVPVTRAGMSLYLPLGIRIAKIWLSFLLGFIPGKLALPYYRRLSQGSYGQLAP